MGLSEKGAVVKRGFSGALPGRWPAQVREDPLNDDRIVHGGDEAQAAATAGTRENVKLERTVHQHRP
jgi:hypothetical protein